MRRIRELTNKSVTDWLGASLEASGAQPPFPETIRLYTTNQFGCCDSVSELPQLNCYHCKKRKLHVDVEWAQRQLWHRLPQDKYEVRHLVCKDLIYHPAKTLHCYILWCCFQWLTGLCGREREIINEQEISVQQLVYDAKHSF